MHTLILLIFAIICALVRSTRASIDKSIVDMYVHVERVEASIITNDNALRYKGNIKVADTTRKDS